VHLVGILGKAVGGALLRGILIGFCFWVLGEFLVNAQLIPSGSLALGIVGWAIAANIYLAPKAHDAFDRTALAGLPIKEQRSAILFQLFAAGAAALVIGLFFEALVYGLMEYFGVINPYFCILAFGISFGSFWAMYAVLASAPQPQT